MKGVTRKRRERGQVNREEGWGRKGGSQEKEESDEK